MYTSFREWLGPYSDGMAHAVSDEAVHTVACVTCTVLFVAPVSDDRLCRLTPGVPCQYDLTWGNGTVRVLTPFFGKTGQKGIRRSSG
jgi:hypothetical protein